MVKASRITPSTSYALTSQVDLTELSAFQRSRRRGKSPILEVSSNSKMTYRDQIWLSLRSVPSISDSPCKCEWNVQILQAPNILWSTVSSLGWRKLQEAERIIEQVGLMYIVFDVDPYIMVLVREFYANLGDLEYRLGTNLVCVREKNVWV